MYRNIQYYIKAFTQNWDLPQEWVHDLATGDFL